MKYYLLLLSFVFIFSCDTQTNASSSSEHDEPSSDSTHLETDSDTHPEHENEVKIVEELPDLAIINSDVIQEKIGESFLPIKYNFLKINAIEKWDNISSKDIEGSTEGGIATYYTREGQILKIKTEQLGEMGKSISHYYLNDGQLSYAFSETHEYNRPIYYDSTAMVENNDTEYFNPEASIIGISEYFFEKNQLIRIIENMDCGAPFSQDYRDGEEEWLLGQMEILMKKDEE